MTPQEDGYVFESTGRFIYTNSNIIGIDNLLNISQGYDGGIDLGFDEDFDTNELSSSERKELSEFMIDLWTKFANQK